MVPPTLTTEGRWRSRTLGAEDDFYRQRPTNGLSQTPAARLSRANIGGGGANFGSNSTSSLKSIVGTPGLMTADPCLSDQHHRGGSYVRAKAEQWLMHRQIPGLCVDPTVVYNQGDFPEANILRVYKHLASVAMRSCVDGGLSVSYPQSLRRLLCTLSDINEWVHFLCIYQLGISPLAYDSVLSSPDGQAGRDVEQSLCDFTGPRLRSFAASLVECIALQSRIFGVLADVMTIQQNNMIAAVGPGGHGNHSQDELLLPSTPAPHQRCDSPSPPVTPISLKVASAQHLAATPAASSAGTDPFGNSSSAQPSVLSGLQVPQLDLDALLGPTGVSSAHETSGNGLQTSGSLSDGLEPLLNTSAGCRRAARRAVIRVRQVSLSSRSTGGYESGAGSYSRAGDVSLSSVTGGLSLRDHDGVDLRPQWMKRPRISAERLQRMSDTGMPPVAYCEWNIVAFHRLLSESPTDRVVSPSIPVSERKSPLRFMVTATRNPLRIGVEFTVAEPVNVLFRVVCGNYVSPPSWHSFKDHPWAGVHSAIELVRPPLVLTVGVLIEDIRPPLETGSRQMSCRLRTQTDWSGTRSRRVDSMDDIIAELNQRHQNMTVDPAAADESSSYVVNGEVLSNSPVTAPLVLQPTAGSANGHSSSGSADSYRPLGTVANLPSLSNLIQMTRPAAGVDTSSSPPSTVAASVQDLLTALGATSVLPSGKGSPLPGGGDRGEGLPGSPPHAQSASRAKCGFVHPAGAAALAAAAAVAVASSMAASDQNGSTEPMVDGGGSGTPDGAATMPITMRGAAAGTSGQQLPHSGQVTLPLQPTLSRLRLNGLASPSNQQPGHAAVAAAAEVEANSDLFRRIWNNGNIPT